jgi:uncharacterized protein YyaL (SSP411 family)
VVPAGNWEKGKNILYTSYDPVTFAEKNKIAANDFFMSLNEFRSRMKVIRDKRTKPSVDTKVLTSWNAIMLIGSIDGYLATRDLSAHTAIFKTAEFIKKNMLGADGHLWRSYKDGKASIDGFLDDYAFTAKAFLRLYQFSFDKQWLTLAQKITDYAIKNFYDEKSGLFYYTAANTHGLVVRKIEITDNVIPSSNATMGDLLHKLGACIENRDYINKSIGMLSKLAGKIHAMTSYYSQWCQLAAQFSYGIYEVAIMGKDALKKSEDLQQRYLPDCVFLGSTNEENLSLLENKLPDSQTLIYVCTDRVCKLPVGEVEDAITLIRKGKTK